MRDYKDLLDLVIIKRSGESLENTSFIRDQDLEVFIKKTRPTKRNCFVLDLFEDGSIESVFLSFAIGLTGNVQILMESSTLFTDRDLSVQSRYRTGHDIVMPLNPNASFVHKAYDVMLSKNIYVESDPTKGCRNYPIEKFLSYNDCDKDFVQTKLDKRVAKGFLPFWATDDFSQVSTANVTAVDTATLMALYDGSQSSTCPLPCETESMRTILFSEEMNDSPMIQINFASLVPVSKTDFMRFDLSEFLSDIGGSLGLWLGLGVLQLLEVITGCALKIRTNYATKKQPPLNKKV